MGLLDKCLLSLYVMPWHQRPNDLDYEADDESAYRTFSIASFNFLSNSVRICRQWMKSFYSGSITLSQYLDAITTIICYTQTPTAIVTLQRLQKRNAGHGHFTNELQLLADLECSILPMRK